MDALPVKRIAYVALLLGLSAVIVLVAHQGVREVFSALSLGGWKLAMLLPLHLIPLIPDASAWRFLIVGPRRLLRLCWIAWIRQAVNRLLPLASIGGEIVGVRLLIHSGVQAGNAAASVVVEVFTTLVAQYVFVLLGLIVVLQLTGAGPLPSAILLGLALGLPLILMLLFILRRGSVFGSLHQLLLRLIGREGDLRSIEASGRVDAAISELMNDPSRLVPSIALQALSMSLGSLEIWAAFFLLGGNVSLMQAFVVEMVNQTAKHVMFFVPGALGVQELSLVALAPFIGVTTDVAIAASLAKRAVDVVIGVPALAAWQWSEFRQV